MLPSDSEHVPRVFSAITGCAQLQFRNSWRSAQHLFRPEWLDRAGSEFDFDQPNGASLFSLWYESQHAGVGAGVWNRSFYDLQRYEWDASLVQSNDGHEREQPVSPSRGLELQRPLRAFPFWFRFANPDT